ncbi:hypothetical protein R3P38DRAFT_3336690 [Favolaschia claudopus]|uniref:DUF6589 domain-containing protein n=1 Tax=Favolaschia claudopus TaxID=2862362 RepID=A0AAV9Z4P8_9AGAR
MDDDLEFLYVEEPPLERDDTYDHLGNEADYPDLPEDDALTVPEPIYSRHTQNLRNNLQPGGLLIKVLAVLETLKEQRIDLPIFLDAITWGDQDCVSNPTVQYARSSLMNSEELPKMLERWYHPPRRSGGRRPAGARKILETLRKPPSLLLDFAFNCISDTVDTEMKIAAPLFLSPPEDLSEKHLTDLDSGVLKDEVQRSAPILWHLLHRAAYTPEQEARNKHKNPDMMVPQAQYSRSNRRGRIAKLWSIYLKACGLSAPLIHIFPFAISHDNMNIARRVFSQRLDNQSNFINGCAYTVWILPQRAALPADASQVLQSFRAENCLQVFDFAEVLYGSEEADDHMEEFTVDFVLHLLLDTPDFADYPHRSDPSFNHPPPVHQLPGGSENIIELTGTQRIIAWMGDQLTVERLRGLWKYRHEGHNSFDRMDYMIPVFGWFHLVMAFANSIHKQYLGTSAVIGSLRQAFDVLKRKGLITQSTKGPFWHNLDEALHHISEAHLRACWLDLGNIDNLAALKSKSPAELRQMAAQLIRKYASREALNRMEEMGIAERDGIYQQWTMFNMDVIPYLLLRKAIKAGDIGLIEDLLPILLFRFAGSGFPKYTIEILELLQGHRKKWPPDVRDYIKKFCYWLPYDLAQEENICDIKVNYRSQGPGATMEHMGKISPAIPSLRKIQRHMEKQFGTNARGARHGVPDKEKDVAMLTEHYMASKLHTFIPGRELKTARSADFVTEGAENLEKLNTIDEWFKRRTHARATGEDWSEEMQDILLQPML